MGKKFDVKRVEQIVLSGDKNLWKEIGPIVAADPEAKAVTAKAITQVLSEKVAKSPRAIIDIYQKEVRPAIESSNLMSPRALSDLDKQVDEIRRVVDPTRREQLIDALIRGVRYALTAEATRVPAAAMGQ